EVLLCPNTPKPLHGVVPRVILGARWWNATRKAAYKSTEYHCLACGVHKDRAKSRQWLEGHELYDIDYSSGRMTYVETVPLCHYCHNYIHDGRLNSLLQQGMVHHAKYAAIIRHGDLVLAEAGLRKPSLQEREIQFREMVERGEFIDWGEWRLILDGKEYPPLYKDYNEWAKAHGIS